MSASTGSAVHPVAEPTRRPERDRKTRTAGGSTWAAPAALLVLSVIPLVAGSLRLVEIAGGPQLIPVNARIAGSPAPLVVHVVGAAVYVVLGAFQFSARRRRRLPGWHRSAGRVLVAAGLAVAVSGLWMTLFYRGAPGGAGLWTVRLLVGSAMAASIVLGFTAIRHRDIPAHRAWMIRAYALAAGAGTQTLTQGVGETTFGTSDLSTALSLSSAWIINAAVAEWLIHRGPAVQPRTAAVGRAR